MDDFVAHSVTDSLLTKTSGQDSSQTDRSLGSQNYMSWLLNSHFFA